MMSDNPTPPSSMPSLRYEWYQTDDDVIFSVLIKNGDLSLLQSVFLSREIHLCYPGYAPLDLVLYAAIDSPSHPCVVKTTRLEWTLPKTKKKEHWPSFTPTETSMDPKQYPSSAKKDKNWWESLPKEAIKDEDDDNVNTLFQKIYKNASEDTKRAMIKSYTESNGTCLSTNWDEVSKGKVETKPPEGMEVKKFEK